MFFESSEALPGKRETFSEIQGHSGPLWLRVQSRARPSALRKSEIREQWGHIQMSDLACGPGPDLAHACSVLACGQTMPPTFPLSC